RARARRRPWRSCRGRRGPGGALQARRGDVASRGASSITLFCSPERVCVPGERCCSVCAPMPVALSYRRHLGWGVTLAAFAFGLVWVVLLADRPAHSDPTAFFSTLLDAITQGALYFVVASGFTLVFGLMRVVNMAERSLHLVAGSVHIDVQRRIITGNPDTTVSSTQVSVINWFVVLLVAALVAGLLGLLMPQALPRVRPR